MATIYRDEFGRDVYQDPNKGLLSATTGQPITSEMLASLATTNFQTPTIPPPPDVSKIDSEFKPETLGAESQKAQDLTTRIQSIQEQLLGRSSFRREQGTLKDLSARLTALKNQALAIPLQLQEQATGRGITAGGLAPIEAGEMRKNTIQTLAVSSLFEAARGNLTTALDQVDRAVAAKYDPVLEELNVKLANLKLIQESPAYTLEQKNRAAKEKARQLAIREQKEAEKTEQDAVWRIAVNATEIAAQKKTPVSAFDLDRIQKAKTKEEALRIASELGLLVAAKETALPSEIQEFKAFFPNVDLTTPQGQQQFLNWKAREAAAGRSPETTPKAEARDTTVSQFLEGKKGTDGYVSAGSYQEALRKFIANGGTQANFIASFPQQTYLRQEEIDKLPAGLKSIQVTPQKALTADQQALINEAQATWNAAKQTYQATPDLRNRIIQKSKELGFDISPYF